MKTLNCPDFINSIAFTFIFLIRILYSIQYGVIRVNMVWGIIGGSGAGFKKENNRDF